MRLLRECSILCSLTSSIRHSSRKCVIVLVAMIWCGVPSQAQQRDKTALVFLGQVILKAGGSALITAVQDFTAQGTITHYWGESPEQGELTIKSRGSSQFRLDSNLPEGTWSFVANNGNGKQLFPDGTSTQVAFQNLLNAGSLTWPILKVNAALLDPTSTILDVGVVQLGNGQARQIQVQQNSAGMLSKNTKTDYFFDSVSYLILRTQDIAHPNDDALNGGTKHLLDFTNYQNINGLLIPFAISQSIAGQQTWSVQLSSVSFNTGLSDSDFQF